MPVSYCVRLFSTSNLRILDLTLSSLNRFELTSGQGFYSGALCIHLHFRLALSSVVMNGIGILQGMCWICALLLVIAIFTKLILLIREHKGSFLLLVPS